jgi:hypothetical protein
MGRIQDDELVQAMRQLCPGGPSNDAAPVMADEVKPSDAERVGQGDDIAEELGERVLADALGLVAGVVAPLVGNDDPISGGSERTDLPSPADPEVREAVQEHDRLTPGRPGLNDMKPNASGVDELMFRRE